MLFKIRPGTLINLALCFIVGMLVVSALGGALMHRPFLLTAIRSGSMYPTLKRGDAAIIERVGEKTQLLPGDIVVFRSEGGSLADQGWIMHRIVSANSKTGYITKGDANEKTDQESGAAPPIRRDWIVSRAVTIGGFPLKIPLIGYLPIWLEQLQKHPLVLPGIAAALALVVAADEFNTKKKKKCNRRLLHILLYFLSGLTLAVILAGSILAASQYLQFEYEVSPEHSGIIMGSPVGVLKQGEVVVRPLSELKNKGFFPIIVCVTAFDPQVRFNRVLLRLSPGEEEKITMTVTAQEPGKYRTKIWVGMFLPLLPAGTIHFLARRSFWLALAAISLLPALPLILFPILDPQLRIQIRKEFHRMLRHIARHLPLLSCLR